VIFYFCISTANCCYFIFKQYNAIPAAGGGVSIYCHLRRRRRRQYLLSSPPPEAAAVFTVISAAGGGGSIYCHIRR